MSKHSAELQIFRFGAISSPIQMQRMQMTSNWKSTVCRALQQILEEELMSNHFNKMQILQVVAISSPIQL
jgi:hypothetical protein